MLRSFYAGIGGLRNHQQSMDVIGNNISNVNTPGFKGSRVTFSEALSQTLEGARESTETSGGKNPMQIGLGMTVASIDKNMNQGSLQSTGNNLDMAIEGPGYFVVGNENSQFYTRVGSFSVDDKFNLVTSTGDQVQGWYDSDGTGSHDGLVNSELDAMGFINLDRRGDGWISNVLASVTPPIRGPNRGDASMGDISTFDTTVSDEWLVECTDASQGIFTITGSASGQIGTIPYAQPLTDPDLGGFVINSGEPAKAHLSIDTNGNGEYLGLVAKEHGGGANNMHMEIVNKGINQNLSITVAGNKLSVSLATNNLGQSTSTEADIAAAIMGHPQAKLLVDADVYADAITDPETLPPLVAGSPDVAATTIDRFLQNGAGANQGDYFTFRTTAAGAASVQTITVSRDGTIVGVFDNGTTEELAKIGVATIPNPQGLLAIGGGKFAASTTSGQGVLRVPGDHGTGPIASGFLEMSNVDLTREFTDMIVTQRGFQANSRIITTSDEMLQELLSIKR